MRCGASKSGICSFQQLQQLAQSFMIFLKMQVEDQFLDYEQVFGMFLLTLLAML